MTEWVLRRSKRPLWVGGGIPAMEMMRLECLGRSKFSREQRAGIVAECCRAGASLRVVAGRHGVPVETVRRWLRIAGRLEEVEERGAGPLPAFVPLVLEEQGGADDDGVGWGCGRFGHGHGGPCGVDVAEVDPAVPTRLVLATRPVMYTKQHDGLAGVMEAELGLDPYSGMAVVFRCRRRDRIKVLWWEGRSLMVVHKRLERGWFTWPAVHHGAMHLSREQFELLFGGLDWRGMLNPRVVRAARAV